MANSCEISFDRGVVKGKTHPKLMRNLLVETNNDVDSAIVLYGTTLSDEFKATGVTKPSVANVKGFLEQSNINHSDTLFTKDELSFLTRVSSRFQESDGMLNTLNEALKENGTFKLDTDKLYSTGLFTEQDLVFVQDNASLLESIHYKIEKGFLNGNSSDYDFVFNSVMGQRTKGDNDFIEGVKNDSSKNSSNPDVTMYEMLSIYAGVNSIEDVKSRAEYHGHTHILENENLVEELYNISKDLQPLVSYRYDGKDMVKVVNNDMVESLEQGLDINQDLTDVSDFLEDVLNKEQVTPDDVADVSDYLKEKGVDISELKGVAVTDKVVDLLQSLYIMLRDVIQGKANMSEAIRKFVRDFKEVVGNTETTNKKLVPKLNKSGVFIHIDSSLSEQELFFRWGLVKVKDNIYQKFSDISETNTEELYETLYSKGNKLPEGFITKPLKEIYKSENLNNIKSRVKDLAFEYVNNEFSLEDAEKLVIYKVLSGNLNTEVSPKNYTVTNKELDVSTFTSDIYSDIINNEELNELLHITTKGVEAKVDLGPYSIATLKNLLSENLFNNLVDYAKITGSESLRPLTELNNDVATTKDRNYYANNIGLLNNYRGVFEREGDNIRTINDDEFIRIGDELFERIGNHVYGKVQREEDKYNFNLKKPEKTMDDVIHNDSVLSYDEQVSKTVRVAEKSDSGVKFC